MNISSVFMVPVSYSDLFSHPWASWAPAALTLLFSSVSRMFCLESATQYYILWGAWLISLWSQIISSAFKFLFLCGICLDFLRVSQVVVSWVPILSILPLTVLSTSSLLPLYLSVVHQRNKLLESRETEPCSPFDQHTQWMPQNRHSINNCESCYKI